MTTEQLEQQTVEALTAWAKDRTVKLEDSDDGERWINQGCRGLVGSFKYYRLATTPSHDGSPWHDPEKVGKPYPGERFLTEKEAEVLFKTKQEFTYKVWCNDHWDKVEGGTLEYRNWSYSVPLDFRIADPLDAIAPGHNPDRLTVRQVGEGWRLLERAEIVPRPETTEAQYLDRNDRLWSSFAVELNNPDLTYRTQQPPGYFLPKPTVRVPLEFSDWSGGPWWVQFKDYDSFHLITGAQSNVDSLYCRGKWHRLNSLMQANRSRDPFCENPVIEPCSKEAK